MSMTIQEFKAWFDGFCEGVGDVPTKAQWAKVKEKLNEVKPPEQIKINLKDIEGNTFLTDPWKKCRCGDFWGGLKKQPNPFDSRLT